MSQNDFTLVNQSFPSFRADLNSALQALASNNSGTSAPSTTFANMWWYDSSNNIMYIRNEDNDAWIKFAELDQANDKFVLSGTLQLDDGTVSAPALTFNSDTNMGIYRGGTDILKFVTAGTDAITIDANQNVGIGTSSPASLFGSGITVEINGSGGAALRLARPSYANGDLYADENGLTIRTQNNYQMRFLTNNTLAATIDTSQNLLVGTTNSLAGINNTDEGISLRTSTGSASSIVVSRDAGVSGYFNRNSDGDILSLRKDGSAIGSIGVLSARPYFGKADTGIFFNQNINAITPYNIDLATQSNGVIDLGTATTQFKDLYLSGGVVFGSTGGSVTSKTLDDYEEGTWSPTVTGSATLGTATFSGTQDGFYVKVGSLVTVNFSYTTTAHTGTGKIRIGNLPFTSTSSSGYQAVGTFMANNYNFSDSSPINGNLYLQREVTQLRIYLTADNLGWTEQDLDSAHGLIASITYRTDA
jgi:hypothetical protein